MAGLRGCFAAVGVLGVVLMGCASPGVPRPPSLRLPEKATGLQAERVGGEVRLTWTTPANTTDGDAVRGGISAALCRAKGAAGACVPLRQVGVVPGPASAVDALPGTLRVGADSLLGYRVELRNERGRSAGVSEEAFAAGGRAPEMPAGVTAVATRDGVLVRWQADAGGAAGAVMQLRRTGGALPGSVAKAKGGRKVPFGQAEKPADGAVVLVADGKGEAGGMVDRSARNGESYTYVAQRVRRVQVAGHALELRSVAAEPVSVVYRDTFAPAAPVGLATVPGGGFGSAPTVDLSWEPNGEGDVRGYRVYRAVDGGAFALVGEVAVAAYRDLRVSGAHTYGYRVTAVDGVGNEGERSAEAREVLR